MKALEYLFAILLIGTLLLCCLPICVYGLIMAVVDKIITKRRNRYEK